MPGHCHKLATGQALTAVKRIKVEYESDAIDSVTEDSSDFILGFINPDEEDANDRPNAKRLRRAITGRSLICRVFKRALTFCSEGL